MAFFLRMFGSIAYSMMIQYYYGYGDSFTYFYGSDFLVGQVKLDFDNLKYFFASAEEVGKWFERTGDNTYYTGYMSTMSNLFVMKIAAFVSLFSFNKFLITSLIFGFFSFAGQWRLFKVFNDINKGRNLKLLAYGVLYTPAIWFWAGGLMKDSICLGALGFIVAILYKLFIKKKFSLIDLLFLPVLLLIIYTIKSYIVIVLVVSLATFVFARFLITIKNSLVRALLILLFLLAATLFAFISNIGEQIQLLAEESKVQVDFYQKNYGETSNETEDSKGTIGNISEVDATVGGMLLHSPVAIFTCMFRPLLWESRKLIILFAALESTLLLLCTFLLLYKTKFWGFIRIILENEYALFAFVLSMLFALIIGFTTYNFGTIVRYKTILLPFYYFLLVYIYTIHKNKNPAK